MQRVKNIDYDEDELYDDGDYEEQDEGYTEEDRNQFAVLTPVVRVELEEAGLQASDREIEDALWNYYWDVGKSVTFLKNNRKPKTQPQQSAKKEKPKSKFDEAAEKSAQESDLDRAATASDWFRDVAWTMPLQKQASLVPSNHLPRQMMLGGSSKLAKLAEERRKKGAASSSAANSTSSLSSLDRLSKAKTTIENEKPAADAPPELRRYAIRRKREPTPPPREPTPPLAEPEEEKPDIRASPTEFARTLATSLPGGHRPNMSLSEVLGAEAADDPFKVPSPDDTVRQAQQTSKGLMR
ncbi:hypothetical protein LTR78_001817 [Recurvomyces mirabilis]|uniref:HBS1-like protein N-terminal domain-containing protein n=1 Tax=Recurvomyces mirabilis TaxID=574656 RepID=A0AAE0WVW2_9PEZI|nr:hypothetical protein LTR78_001817 [Recurvomyces mirabilis]KAK5156742.1 hypothetical protein LTS14_004955 [Recurvomyces mirabilis]